MSQYQYFSGNFSHNIHLLNGNNNCFNGTNYIALSHPDERLERLEILAWLSRLDPRALHRNIQTTRVGNVGHWFLQTDEFKNWCGSGGEGGSDDAALFCCGDLGVGKTYISSLIIDELRDRAEGQATAIVCSYYDFTAREEQSPANVLGSLLHQLVSGLENTPAELADVFKGHKMALGGQLLHPAKIVELFRAIILASSRRALICIDALDECAWEHRPNLFKSLRDILRGSPRTRLFLTGRPHIRSEVEKHLRGAVTIVSIATNEGDVVNYLRTRMGEDPVFGAMNSNLEAEIVNRVIESMSKIFRLVSINIEGILREPTIHLRRKRLYGTIDGLDLGILYGPTLERIEALGYEKLSLAMAALMWVCYSEQPLHMDELRHALAVEIGSTDFEPDNVPLEETLLNCCQGLIIVDKESSTARLIHSTLRDYLLTLSDFVSAHSGFVSAHSKIAETCLTYLNSQRVKNLSANLSPDLRDTPFLNYSSRYWGTHAKMDLSKNAKSLALQLFSQYDGHISARLLLQQVCSWNIAERDSSYLFTGLHCASFFGIVEIVGALMGMESCGINQRDRAGVTPLIWAAMRGHRDVVKLLLEQEGVDPNIRDRDHGRTALSWAEGNGHGGVVELLPKCEGVNFDNSGNTCTTCDERIRKRWKQFLGVLLECLAARAR